MLCGLQGSIMHPLCETEFELVQLLRLLFSLTLNAAVYTYGGKPVPNKVVTFTVTDRKTGATKTYTGTTDANGVVKVAVDASSLPAVADVYASAPSSKPDANGPVAATLAPGSGELL
jgi:hypothetical protein